MTLLVFESAFYIFTNINACIICMNELYVICYNYWLLFKLFVKLLYYLIYNDYKFIISIFNIQPI